MKLETFKDIIVGDKEITSEGCTLLPIGMGSDKTTVSVATGQNDYHPLYIFLGNVHNNVRRAHRGAVAVIAFLSVFTGIISSQLQNGKLMTTAVQANVITRGTSNLGFFDASSFTLAFLLY